MKRSGIKAKIYDPKEMFKTIGSAEIFQFEEIMSLNLYDKNNNEIGYIDISDILRLIIQLV